MDVSIKKSNFNESTLIWAIICSILLHALLAITLPNLKFDTLKKPVPLEIELQKPAAPEPVAEVQPIQPPEQPKPEVKKPEPIKKIIEPKPITKTVEAPSPVTEVEQAAPPVEMQPAPTVIAVQPKTDTAPVAVVVAPPAPEVAKAPERSPAEVDNALGEYGNLLGRAIAKHKQYPRIAQTRGWEGEVLLDLKLDGNGKVLSVSIKQGSGYDALDKQALEMVRKASPFPAPPETLRNRTFNITVPVSFKLE
ncbi:MULTISPECIES: energy transducer TonB [Methylotenera]|uniref:energy transducer TonB n=1 Tax=Methylotenera TaxID=359407 RepID=UPI00037CB966|nr:MULTISPECIES: energy transducer TonB [Methylotenera]